MLILTVDWCNPLAFNRFVPLISHEYPVKFCHAVVGNRSKLHYLKENYSDHSYIDLTCGFMDTFKYNISDIHFLRSLEKSDLHTIKVIIESDRVLKYLSEDIALGYIVWISKKLYSWASQNHPKLILATYDNAHSYISLLIARTLGINWTTFSYPAIPKVLTGFGNSMYPDDLTSLMNISREKANEIAYLCYDQFINKEVKPLMYKPILLRFPNINILKRTYNRILHRSGNQYTHRKNITVINQLLVKIFRKVFYPYKKFISKPPNIPYVTYMMHMQPESTIDVMGAEVSNQIHNIEHIYNSLPADVALVVKLHPSSPFNLSIQTINRLVDKPYLYIACANLDSSLLLAKSKVVFSANGTSLIESALLGIQGLALGRTPYTTFTTVNHASRDTFKLRQQILQCLETQVSTREQILFDFSNYIMRYSPGSVNNWKVLDQNPGTAYETIVRSFGDYLRSIKTK